MDEYRPFPGEPIQDEESEAAGEPGAEAGAVAASTEPRPERPAPNTQHPGGHLHGQVARLNRPRRFGFLRADDGVEVFFHASALEAGANTFDRLRPGQEVEFDCHQDEQGRGLAASLVRVLGEPPEPTRQPRQPRPEQAERVGRSARAGASTEGWHVAVLSDRYDAPASTQLERLLNERGVKPGQFTLALLERAGETECWVAYFVGEARR